LRRHGFASAVAIEPAADNVRLLRMNLVLNDVDDRVRVVASAVSDTVGTATLALAAGNSGDHRLNMARTRREQVEVACTTLDRLVADGELDPGRTGLVWMDTQGHEGAILRAAGTLLAGRRPSSSSCRPRGWPRTARSTRARASSPVWGGRRSTCAA